MTQAELEAALPDGWRVLHYPEAAASQQFGGFMVTAGGLSSTASAYSATHDASGALASALSPEKLVAQCEGRNAEWASRGIRFGAAAISRGVQ